MRLASVLLDQRPRGLRIACNRLRVELLQHAAKSRLALVCLARLFEKLGNCCPCLASVFPCWVSPWIAFLHWLYKVRHTLGAKPRIVLIFRCEVGGFVRHWRELLSSP